MSFAYPWLLLLLPAPLLLLVIRHRMRRRAVPTAAWSHLGPPPRAESRRVIFLRGLPLLRLLALLVLVVALARPRFGHKEVEVTSEGIDIVLAIDTSGSMRAEDFQPLNRLNVAKQVARSFVNERQSDRIGLVVFGPNAYTQCPLTSDHAVLDRFIESIDFDDGNGTAIGMGIATSLNRLRDVRGKSRLLILLTDGQNNAGSVDPETAAELARSLGVKIYTVGVGTEGQAPVTIEDPVFGKRVVYQQVDIDEETLEKVAATTGGQYYRATDAQALEAIYTRINQLEKSRVETREWVNYSEFGSYLALPALLLVCIEFALGATLLRRLP